MGGWGGPWKGGGRTTGGKNYTTQEKTNKGGGSKGQERIQFRKDL